VSCYRVTRTVAEGSYHLLVPGHAPEAQASAAAVIESVKRAAGGQMLSHHIIARPHENLEYVLPIRYTEQVQQFREDATNIRPYLRP